MDFDIDSMDFTLIKMPELIYTSIIAGILFVLIGIRLLNHLVHEIAFFSGVFGIIATWHYWGTAFLNMPELPMWALQFSASAFLLWAVLKVIFILSLFPSPIQPIFMFLSSAVNGK